MSIYDLISRLNEGMRNDISSGVRIFVAVAGRQHVTQAAHALNVAQSAVSHAPRRSPACSACQSIDAAGQPAEAIASLAGLDPLYIEREPLGFSDREHFLSGHVKTRERPTPEQIPAVAAYVSSLHPTQQHSSFGGLECAGRDLALCVEQRPARLCPLPREERQAQQHCTLSPGNRTPISGNS
jgi:cytochrome c553